MGTNTITTNDFDPFAREYVAHRTRTAGRPPSRRTLENKVKRLRAVARRVEAPSVVSFAHLLGDRKCASRLLDELLSEMTSGSLTNYYYALRDFGDWAVRRGFIEENCLEGKEVLPPNGPRKPITVYGDDEVDALVAAARGQTLRFWALLAYIADTGRRIGETLDLEWSWFRLDVETPYVELPYTKNGEPQYVPLGTRLREEVLTSENVAQLKRWDRREGHVPLRSAVAHPFPWGYGSVRGRFVRLCEVVGIEYRGFHNLRHTRATDWIAKGVPMQAVAALLGHADVGVTARIYNHASALAYTQYVE